ncbi:hypothetical protein HN51_009301 [Arachis hypogaea]
MEEDVLRARECWRMKWTAAMEPAMELRRYSWLRVKATWTGEELQTVVRVQLLGRDAPSGSITHDQSLPLLVIRRRPLLPLYSRLKQPYLAAPSRSASHLRALREQHRQEWWISCCSVWMK